jgi:hypothetical protein
MKKAYLRYGLLFVLVACLFAFPLGCGSKSDKTAEGESVEPTPLPEEEGGVGAEVEEPVESAADRIILTVNPGTIDVEGTATVTADVRRENNNPVADGTTVIFSVQNTAFGTITESATTTAGIATATFTAANSPGTATIEASSGSATRSVTIDIEQVPAAAIKFLSADPDVIALAGTGGTEISEIQFEVVDSNDNPLEAINVTFTMVGPNGGEYIQPDAASTNGSGVAMVRLYAGSVAGPVTVSATTDVGDPPTPMTVQSTVVSIGGGVPSDKRFSVAATKLNLPGLEWNGKTTEVSAWLADRFGSYNILEGTTVSYGTEVGLATDTATATLDDTGVASVTVRTQGGAGGAHAEDVLPEVWEVDLQTYLSAAYGFTGTTAHPRDGLCTVLVYTKGEEHFDDLYPNGVYDGSPPDQFLPAYDTAEDPFYDYDDDDQYNDGSTYPAGGPPYNPAELYFDSAVPPDGWDGGDGVWSADTYLFRNFKILVTGPPITSPIPAYNGLIPATAYSFSVPDGGARSIGFLVCDENFNQLVAGSTVDITSSVGGLAGYLSHEYSESNQVGPDLINHLGLIEYVVTIYDNDPGDGDPPVSGEISVTVVWKPEGEAEQELKLTIGGTVD